MTYTKNKFRSIHIAPISIVASIRTFHSVTTIDQMQINETGPPNLLQRIEIIVLLTMILSTQMTMKREEKMENDLGEGNLTIGRSRMTIHRTTKIPTMITL